MRPVSQIAAALVLILLAAATCLHAQAPTTTTAAPAVTTAITPPPNPGGPASASDTDVRFDLVFADFQEEDEYRSNILQVMRAAVNITNFGYRLVYSRTGTDKNKGYLFGDDIIVRFKIVKRRDGSEKLSAAILQEFNSLVQPGTTSGINIRLSNIGVKRFMAVPANAKVPVHNVRTKWDLLWTLAIVAGGLFFLLTLLIIAYRIMLCVRRSAEDAKAAKEEKEEEEMLKKRESGGGDKDDEKEAPTSLEVNAPKTQASWEEPDDDEMGVIQQLAMFSMQTGGTGLLHVPAQTHQQHAVSQHKRQAIDRKMELDFALPDEKESFGLDTGSNENGGGGGSKIIINDPLLGPPKTGASTPDSQNSVGGSASKRMTTTTTGGVGGSPPQYLSSAPPHHAAGPAAARVTPGAGISAIERRLATDESLQLPPSSNQQPAAAGMFGDDPNL